MKSAGRLTRCPLKGTFCEVLFATLCACGHNIRKILAHHAEATLRQRMPSEAS